MAEQTPRTLIRAVAEEEEEEDAGRRRQPTLTTMPPPPPPPQPQPPKRGGVGGMTVLEDETPRRLISALAAGMLTEEQTSVPARSKRTRMDTDSASAGMDSNNPKNMIRRFLRDAITDSRERPTRAGDREDEYFPVDEGHFSEAEEEEEAEEAEEEDYIAHAQEQEQATTTTTGGLTRKPEPKYKYIIKGKRSDAFSKECEEAFKTFLASHSKPNRATDQALDVMDEAVGAYLKQTVRDYARLARLEDASTHHLTRDRLEALLRAQGLLVGPLGDEMRRLMDKEDTARALKLPISRAKLERM